jgi:hypothetical protein
MCDPPVWIMYPRSYDEAPGKLQILYCRCYNLMTRWKERLYKWIHVTSSSTCALSQHTWGVGNQVRNSYIYIAPDYIISILSSRFRSYENYGCRKCWVLLNLPVRCDLSEECPGASSFAWAPHTSSSTKTQSNSQKHHIQTGTGCQTYTRLVKMCRGMWVSRIPPVEQQDYRSIPMSFGITLLSSGWSV